MAPKNVWRHAVFNPISLNKVLWDNSGYQKTGQVWILHVQKEVGLQMVQLSPIAMARPFENRTIWNLSFKKSRFQMFPDFDWSYNRSPLCKYNSVLILRASKLGALVKYTSRLEENKLVSYRTNLICTSNNYCCKYNCVGRLKFFRANQSVNICYSNSYMAFLDKLICSLPPSQIVSFEGFKFSRQFVPSLFSLSKLLLQRFHWSHSLIELGLRGLHFFLEAVLVLP